MIEFLAVLFHGRDERSCRLPAVLCASLYCKAAELQDILCLRFTTVGI
jgi:hypothetical protein